MSPPMCSIVLYLVCAGMMTVRCAELDKDKREIAQYEAMFKQFRDKKSKTDHYRLVYGALRVFHQCDVAYKAGESVAKFRSLSFVGQIDLVIDAFVKMHLLPDGFVNQVKQNAITEADFRSKYQALLGGFLKGEHFDPEKTNCRMILHYFLVKLFSSEYSESDETRSGVLGRFFSGFYEEFMNKVYNSRPKVVYTVPKAPTWKVPRWQTVGSYLGGASMVGALIAAGMHFWPTNPTRTMAKVSNSTQAIITRGLPSTGGVHRMASTASSPWTIIIIVIMINLVAIVAALVVYFLMSSTAHAGTPSSNSFAQSKATTTESNSTVATATPVSH